MTKAILVTGALGQIGAELVPTLCRRFGTDSAVASDIRMPSGEGGIVSALELLDCTNLQQIQDVVRRHEVGTIYHLAALADEIRKHIPEFAIDYEVDPVRQAIADFWSRSIDDSAARREWDGAPKYDLAAMTRDMLEKLRPRLRSAVESA